ncbi:tRNA (Guanine-1)-methyltransferase [Cryptosporidium felis]|nr:tRNA (Guanine-1)-methyltransferase [Cryptosporidium felis]
MGNNDVVKKETKDDGVDNYSSTIKKSLCKKRSNRKTRNYVDNIEYLNNIGKGPTIIIDCDFDDKSSDRNIRSLIVQLSLSYSYIRKSKIPLEMIICGVSNRLKQGLSKTLAETWLGVEISDKKIEQIVNSDRFLDFDIIYLTADSKNLLQFTNYSPAGDDRQGTNKQGFSENQVFIIGGIVDRNKYKNISKFKAEKLNLKTAKLPILESGITLNSNQVLTINHVVECIVKYNETYDWFTTFNSILPKRKKE